MTIDGETHKLWRPQPGWLNTASYGLPPQPAWDALQEALADWHVGAAPWEDWDPPTERARESFARLVGVDVADVSVGAQVSQMLAPVAAATLDGARVVTAGDEFSSAIFPWLVHADRGVQVTTAPLGRLADAVAPGTDAVVFSLVQSNTGDVAPYADIVAAARSVGAQIVVDATQACGWLPFDAALADVVVVGAYKWLMAPRGTALAYLSPAVRERMTPLAAGWYASDEPYASFYGPPLRLADTARRFDISPAWFNWIATAPSLEVVEQIGVAAINEHDVALANRFLAGLGYPSGNSAIVSVDMPGAEERLAAAKIRASVRGGRLRAAFHIYNTVDDVDNALDALVG